MTNIIVVFPKIEDAKSIKNVLVRNGFSAMAACTTGAQAIGLAEDYTCLLYTSGGSVIKETAAGAIQPPLLFLPVCQPVFPYLYFPPYFLRFLPYCLP